MIGIAGLGCVLGPRPLREFTLAHKAMESARAGGASQLAPSFLDKAERHYQKGLGYFDQNEREKSRIHFTKAREYAEKAENQSRVKKFKSGDFLPEEP